MIKKVAVVGAGFSGLAAAWYLTEKYKAQVTVFDSKNIGEGTSGVAAGLLHPYAGAHSKLNWMGYEGLAATCDLLDISSQTLNLKVYQDKGILRPVLDEDQKRDFKICVHAYPEKVIWCSEQECQELIPGMIPAQGILIKEGISVDTRLYLEGLWLACQQRGAQFLNKQIIQLNELNEYDLVVVAAGADIVNYSEFSHFKVSRLKGQLLKLEWPKGTSPLQLPLNGYIYVVMDRDGKSCWAGATFERLFVDDLPDEKKAKEHILPQLEAMYPQLKGVKVLSCEAGIRAITPQKKPLFGWLDERTGYITGMGSKGLLYHAFCAKKLIMG